MAESRERADVTDTSVPSNKQWTRAHGWFLTAVLASVLPAALVLLLPSGAMAQDKIDDEEKMPESQVGSVSDAAEPDSEGAGLGLSAIPPVEFSGYGDLAEGYSTNSQGTAGSAGKDDTFTRGRIGFDLRYVKPRLTANLSYSLTGTYWSKFHRQNHLTNRLNLASRLIAIPDMLFVSANAFAAPADLTRLGPSSASGEPISRFNSRDTYGYSVRPQFVLQFKDYLKNSLTVSHSAVFFVRPSTDPTAPPPPIAPARDALTTSVMDELSSGSNFDRVKFSVIGSYTQSSQSVRSQRVAEALGNISYAVTRFLKVFGTGGYSDFKSSQKLAKDLSGPTGLGGVTLSDGPDFELTAEAGVQNNFPTYMGSLRWVISPLTRIVARATDSITTPQGDILSRLAQMGGGDFTNIGTGLGAGGNTPLSPGGLALDNSIYRIRSIDASLVHTGESTTYTASLFANERDRLDVTPGTVVLPRTSVYGVRTAASHKLGANLTATASATYSLGNEFGGHDRVFYGDAGLNYRLSETIDLYLTDHYTHRESKNLVGFSNAPVSEDQVIVGIRAHF